MRKNRKSIFSALLANLLIAVTKFIAGAYTNSSSMIAEGIHSVVDTTNELLLLFGLRKSKKPADQSRPFGYGRELYFWSFIVSILIFGLGGGLSVFQGVVHIRNPEPLQDPAWNYVVLGCSVIFEGSSFFVAVREFNKTRGDLSFWKAIVKSKDPSSFLILFEDGAAVLGLIIVFILMQCSHAFQLPLLDGVASVLVGLLLIFVSLILARESHSLLIGEGISKTAQAQIRELAEQDEAVCKVLELLSIYESPDEIVLTLMIQFRKDLDTEGITTAIERLRITIMREFELIRFVLIQPERKESEY